MLRPDSKNGFQQQRGNQDNALLIVSNQKQDEIKQDVQNRLYQVPGEEDVLEDLAQLQKAKDLEDQWKEIKKQQEIQQAILTQKKLEKMENEQRRLAERLEDIVTQPQFDDSEAKFKLIALKRRIEQDHKDEAQKLEQQFMINKEHELEKIVRKKIEAEQLLEKKKKMNIDLLKLQAELEAIQEVKNEKDINSKFLLDKALKRMGGDELQKNDFMTEKDKVLLADAVLDDAIEGERQKELILMEVQSKINQQRSKAQMDNQDKIRQLNELRATISDKQEKILMDKAIHGEIIKKGLQFLTEVELGNAPPMEMIKKNVTIDDKKLDQYRNNLGVPQIVQKSKGFVNETQIKLVKLKQSLQNDIIGIKPYNNELKPYLNRQSPENLFITRKAVDAIIEYAFRKILEDENKLELLKRMKFEFKNTEEEIVEQQRRNADRNIIIQLSDEMFKRVMKKIQKEAATEIATVNLIAQSVALNIIVSSIKNERLTPNTINRLQELFTNLRDPNTLKKIKQINPEDDMKFNFKNQKEIDWKKVKKSRRNNNEEQLQKNFKAKKKEKKEKRQSFVEEEEYKKPVKQEDEDLDVIILDPQKDCVETLGLDRVKDYEIYYWEKVTLQYLSFRDHSQLVKSYVTFLTMSPFKEYVLAGMNNGEVYIYDALSSPSVANALVSSATQSAVVDIQFAMDNIGHLAILDEGGTMRFCYNAYNLKTNISKEALKGIQQLPEAFQPMFYLEYLNFTYKYFIKRKENQDDIKNYQISYASFHPALTFSCLQPYIMMGTHDGTILKFNTNKDLFSAKNFKYPIHNVLNCRVIVNEDSNYPESMGNFLNIEQNPAGTYEGKNPHIFREFFQGHKAKIVFICFLTYPENIITIDAEGYMIYWEYEISFYELRDRSFRPKQKYKVLMETNQFEPVQKERKQTFPDQKKKNQSVSSMAEQGTSLFEEYFSEDNLKILYEKPLKQGQSELLVCMVDLPLDNETEMFETLIISRAQKQIFSIYRQEYRAVPVNGYVALVKSSLVSQYLYLEIIKPHQINQDLIRIEFVAINTNGFRLKKLKAYIEGPVAEKIDFEVVDNYYPFMISYLFLNMPQGIVVMSLATGCVLKVIKEHLEIVKASFPAKQIIANGLQVIENESIFISFRGSNGVWRFDINDTNDEDEKVLIYENARLEYEKLFRQ